MKKNDLEQNAPAGAQPTDAALGGARFIGTETDTAQIAAARTAAAQSPSADPEGSQSERRRGPRKLLRRSAKVLPAGRSPLRARTIELSRYGLSLYVEEPLKAGVHRVIFDVSMAGNLATVNVQARLIYCVLAGRDGFRVGFEVEGADPQSVAAIEAFLAAA
jgi:hypothetical protein